MNLGAKARARRLLCVALAVLCFGRSVADAATEQPRILLMVDGQASALVGRLRAELEALGFVVVPEARAGRTIAERAKAAKVSAALRVTRARDGVEVWVTDDVGGKTALRETVIASGPEGGSDGVIAVRAVELLRATFLEIDIELPQPELDPPPLPSLGEEPETPEQRRPEQERQKPAPSEPTKPALEKPEASAARSDPERDALSPMDGETLQPRRWRLALGAAPAFSPGGVPAQVLVIVEGAYRTSTRSSFGAAGGFTVSPSTVSGAEGTADVRTAFAVTEISWSPLAESAAVRPWLGAGFGFVRLATRGTAREPFEGGSDKTMAALAVGRVGVSATPFVSWLFVGFDARVGIAAPEPAVMFADKTRARWGRPLVVTSATVGLSL